MPINETRWTSFNRHGDMEVVECDDTTIRKRASVTAKDMKTAFYGSYKILGTEKAIIVNLVVIKAIITVEEVLLLEPRYPEISTCTLVERLKQQFPQKNGPENAVQASSHGLDDDPEGTVEGNSELPFEFQVLEIALEFFCSFVDSKVAVLETKAWSLLEKQTNYKVRTWDNQEMLQRLKRDLTCLQKVREEIQHLLVNKEDMADLYITRKSIQNKKPESIFGSTTSTKSNSNSTKVMEKDDVEDLAMLLKTYFTKLEKIRNKILMMKEHICNREGRMDLIKLKVKITHFVITVGTLVVIPTLVAMMFGMNIPIDWSVAAFFTIFFIFFMVYDVFLY